MEHGSEVHTIAIPYALHALPEDEIEQFQAHLEHCESCRDEVDDVRSVAARLGEVETRHPPADLRQRVLDEIAEVRPLPPIVDDAPRQVGEGRSGRRRWWPLTATGVAAALLVVVGVLTSVVVDQSQRLDDQDATRDAIGRVATATDMRQSAARTADGRVIVMSSRSQDAAVVFPVGMDPAPEGKDYQVWFMRGDEIRSAGLLRAEDGTPRPLAADNLDEATRVGITAEPDGGSDQPTSKPLILIDVKA